MSDKTGIEWCDSTWNPIVGCSILSPGCTNCYAMKMAARIEKMNPGSHYVGTTQPSKAGAVWTGKVALAPERTLTAPLRWKRGRRIFVNSMGDLFHESIPDEWIDRVLAVMAIARQHTFQILTKRAERMRKYFVDDDAYYRIHHQRALLPGGEWRGGTEWEEPASWPLPNVWLGVSAERQQEADERLPDLRATPAAVRFVSIEPLLGPINLLCPECGTTSDAHAINCTASGSRSYLAFLDWVIVGGESGARARPMHPRWARDLRDQCVAAGVSFFYKQTGEWAQRDCIHISHDHGYFEGHEFVPVKSWTDAHYRLKTHTVMERMGTSRTGRLLDGIEWSQFPSSQQGATSHV